MYCKVGLTSQQLANNPLFLENKVYVRNHSKNKPRVDFIIILLFKVPRVSDFAFAFFHRASSFLLFPSTYVVLHFLSFISRSFSTSFSFFFSFPQSEDSHPPVHTSPLLSATCPGSFYLSEQEAEAPTLPIFLSLLSPAHPSISPVRCILLLSKQGDQPSQG